MSFIDKLHENTKGVTSENFSELSSTGCFLCGGSGELS